MKLNQKKYYAKVLLFGEYTVLQGSDALAIPCDLFHGRWAFDEECAKTQSILYDLHEYLQQLTFANAVFDQERFKSDLDQFLCFEANIPIGYGAGSSGAVCAAIFDFYYEKENALTIDELKNILARMENFFHGSSSGLDPLVSYLNEAILLKEGNLIRVNIPENTQDYHLFLLNTEVPRRTAPLVEIYMKKLQTDANFQKLINTELSFYNNQAITFIQEGKLGNLFNIFEKISTFQYLHFEPMILNAWKGLWLDSLKSDFYKLKLCGAGGGGFILGMTKDWNRLEHLMTEKNKNLYKIY